MAFRIDQPGKAQVDGAGDIPALIRTCRASFMLGGTATWRVVLAEGQVRFGQFVFTPGAKPDMFSQIVMKPAQGIIYMPYMTTDVGMAGFYPALKASASVICVRPGGELGLLDLADAVKIPGGPAMMLDYVGPVDHVLNRDIKEFMQEWMPRPTTPASAEVSDALLRLLGSSKAQIIMKRARKEAQT